MKAPAFEYMRVSSLAEACEALGREGDRARLLAGGQSLVPALNMRLMAPDLLIDIGGLAELREIAREGDMLRIGAMVRHAEAMRSTLVAEHAPMIVAALAHVAHPAIRNRGTIGGNLAHADPASELPACMLALDAVLVAHGPGGVRKIAAEDFFLGLFSTALDADEILVAIEIPVATAQDRWTFDELARRSGDYAIVGLSTRGRRRPGAARNTFEDLRLAFFSIGDRPTLAQAAAAALAGAPLDETRIAQACERLEADLSPQSDLQASAATRLHLARVMLRRALLRLTDEAAE